VRSADFGRRDRQRFRRVTTAIFALASLAYITDAPRGLLVKMRHRSVHDKVIRNV
jgi:hypothetical protein